jgi:DNA-binding NtrC family response regulator
MAEGNFREDLYYRLAIIPVMMPPLRTRPEDIPLLVRHLVDLINRRSEFPVSGISRGALDALGAYDWPGNIRELRAALERMVVMADDQSLGVDDLPPKVRAAIGLGPENHDSGVDAFATPTLPEEGLKLASAVERYETALILQALDRTGWNRNQAATLLKMNRTTLVEKIKRKKLTEPGRQDAG